MKGATIFLQIVIILIGIGALALLLWEPHLEGRNAHATLFQVYFNDPFLSFAYVASISFFTGLYQAFKILGYARHNRIFSQAGIRALQTIRFCALALIGFVAAGEIFIMLAVSDDRAGGIVIGIIIAFGSMVVAAAAAVFERILRDAVDMNAKAI